MKRSGRAFTLVEMLIVVAIITALLGFALAIPTAERREEEVRGAAEELAAVLREARTRAMRRNTPYGVVFNIQNAPGSTGRILNNRSGGHWYRLIGPRDTHGGMMFNTTGGYLGPYPDIPDWNNIPWTPVGGNDPVPLQHYLHLVSRSWVDEPHVLARGKVRFLALLDQDNGDNDAPAQGGYYTATYPRPWFGWWDAATGQLHAWGGYDPTLKGETQKFHNWTSRNYARTMVDGRLVSISGFRYEGWEGEVVGCVNPVDREVLADADLSEGAYAAPDYTAMQRWTVYRKGEPRPLINAKWLDYVLVFRPDGTVSDDWFRLRQNGWNFYKYRDTAGSADPYVPPASDWHAYGRNDAGLADMCNGTAFMWNWEDGNAQAPHKSSAQREATSWVHRTGYYWITLAADAKDDTSTFPSAEAALRSLLPIYRVGVSPEGQVRVIRVFNLNQENRSFDPTITGSDWQAKNKIWGKPGATWDPAVPISQPNYVNHELRKANGEPLGIPIHDTVLPEMLRERKWWWKEE